MMRRPFVWRKQYTKAPMGHSTTAAAAKAMNPRVGPKILQWQGLRTLPHSKHKGSPKGQQGGSPAPAVVAATLLAISINNKNKIFISLFQSWQDTDFLQLGLHYQKLEGFSCSLIEERLGCSNSISKTEFWIQQLMMMHTEKKMVNCSRGYVYIGFRVLGGHKMLCQLQTWQLGVDGWMGEWQLHVHLWQ